MIIIGTSGQNVEDIQRCCEVEDPLDVMQNLLQVRDNFGGKRAYAGRCVNISHTPYLSLQILSSLHFCSSLLSIM